MKSLVIGLLTLFAATTVVAAGPWERLSQNIKLPTQAVLEHYKTSPIAASVSYYLLAGSVTSGAATTFTSFLNSGAPDVQRNVTITPTGTTAHVQAGTAVVYGTNAAGQPISENFAIANQQSTATVGAHAFKTITSVVFPSASNTGVTLSVGIGSALGLIHCLNNAGDYAWSEFNGAYDGTRGTMAVSSTVMDLNTFTSATSLNGSEVDVYYAQNYRCYGY